MSYQELTMDDLSQVILPKSSSAANSVVELIAGDFADSVRKIFSGDRLVEFLVASDARRHVWYAWLASADRMGFDANAASADIAFKKLSSTRAAVLIAEAYGRTPEGVLRPFSRLGAKAREPKVYRALVRVLANGGGAAKYVRHCKTLSDNEILGLSLLAGAHTGSRAALELFKKDALGPEKVAFFAWAVSRLEVVRSRQAIDVVLSAPKPWDALWEAIFESEFPAPPWPAVGALKPITSAAALRAAGAQFRNCLVQPDRLSAELRHIVAGVTYFYAWEGAEPALLKFERLGGLGWYAREMNGLGNVMVAASTKEEIERILRDRLDVLLAWDPGFTCWWDGGNYWDAHTW